MKKSHLNPFLVSGYIGEHFFCDRKAETKQLIDNINGNINSNLFAIRRIGKTGLIKHVFSKLEKQKKAICIYTDIFATRNIKEFTNNLATAIYNKIPEHKSLSVQVTEFIKRLRPVISYDSLTGTPEVSIELSNTVAYQKTIQQLFDFLNHQKLKIVIAIDEFQQITNYPEKNIEAFLRTHIQSLDNTVFIFCGSHQKLMHQIFNDTKRPFYASCATVGLDLIARKEYASFIAKHFNENKRNLSSSALDFILDWTMCHTYYTQMLCNRIFENYQGKISIENVMETCSKLHSQEESTYYLYRSMLTTAQWNLLKAIAAEEMVDKPNSKQFQHKHQLGAISSVNRGLASLLEKELIHKITNVPQPYYTINDKFLLRWLQRK
ncbi:MAG: hypothetical protein RIQ89_2099 [Bacteroidota bacterium]|jgi:AAA+ ATPase superfamily predicted ATPase